MALLVNSFRRKIFHHGGSRLAFDRRLDQDADERSDFNDAQRHARWTDLDSNAAQKSRVIIVYVIVSMLWYLAYLMNIEMEFPSL